MPAKKQDDNAKRDEKDVEVPARAQTTPSDVDVATGEQPGVNEVPQNSPSDPGVVQHLDRDPNDPRTVEPTPALPSLDDPSQQGPEHGRVSNEDDQTPTGKNGPNV